jgi:hypothetical protein
MARQSMSRSGRTRGSWTPRLAGIAAAVLVACGGAAAYVIVSPADASRRADRLPTKVVSVQTVGIVAQATDRHPARLLTNSVTGLRWGPMPPASKPQGDPEWTADSMAGGTYVFIYVPTGQCLASVTRRHRADVALRRCDSDVRQRWQRIHDLSQPDGHLYGQVRSMASGRCLTSAGGDPDAAVLTPCGKPAPPRQLISFWWAA